MLISVSGWDFWTVSVTVHQKLRAPCLKITHGFISKLDADSVPLIIRIIKLTHWTIKRGIGKYQPNWYSIYKTLVTKAQAAVQIPSLFNKRYLNTAATSEWAQVTIWKFISLLQKCLCGWRCSQSERCGDKLSSACINIFRQIVEGTSENVSRFHSPYKTLSIKYISYQLANGWGGDNTQKLFTGNTSFI